MRQPSAVRTPSNLVCRLADATDERLVGGKARNLARLVALGVPVPDGVVLTSAAFNHFLDAERRARAHRRTVSASDVSKPESLQSCAERIAELVTNGVIPREIQGLIREFSTRWSSGTAARRVAVQRSVRMVRVRRLRGNWIRCSALSTEADVERGIKTCWASYWSARALFYRIARVPVSTAWA